jgi:hypothetical protein
MHKKLVFYFILENVPFLLKIDAIFKPCLKKFIFLNEQIKLIQKNWQVFSIIDTILYFSNAHILHYILFIFFKLCIIVRSATLDKNILGSLII